MLFLEYRLQEDGRGGKDSKKALAKAMKKKEKAEKRARDEYEREIRKAREEKRQQEEQRKEEERAKQREEEELRARLAEEERLRREEEEYAKWEQFITLEGEGTDAKEDLFSNQERLDSFIDTLRSRKVADIDEIASEFNMTQEVCDVGWSER